MALPLISCIVPVYNGERYLRETLDSIAAQTYQPIEIIVVDDGSTDRSAEIVAAHSAPIRYLRQANSGPTVARNLGISAACGEYCAFLDADDLWDKQKLERQMARFTAHPELDICIAHAQPFWINELQEEAARLRDHPRSKAVAGYTTGALLAKKNVFLKYGEFNGSLWFGDSMEWFLRLADRGATMEILPEVLLYHRMHKTNHTRRRTNASKEEFLHVIKSMLDRKRQRNSSDAPFGGPRANSETTDLGTS